MFHSGTAMAQLLHGCRAALQGKLERVAAQRSRHEVLQDQTALPMQWLSNPEGSADLCFIVALFCDKRCRKHSNSVT